ncbi:hypothetical protein [Segatella copri]|uniref:hypothetical protein n=1 Tax=Segatella copri TaxID=165179 RepID=UPI001292A4BC|nr:hypothetical protein [Segatella copri]MQM89521.1 hypothetical protein [Segatella copri]MQM97310.1 hypothetical protein [Segatella copri]MQN02455.1 hypothetical protein [Segatella copri]MQN15560.1 hypothetical protein [Segatella copri]MQN18610.1 hypothetical protein [Segatella copri]
MIWKKKINIAEILKDKPQGTKLYSILSDGECFLNEASEDSIYVDIDNRKRFWCFTVYGSTHSFPNGCVLLFPSREMRDWEKFSWKKGDVLISDCGFVCIFKEWASDDYTKFNGCYFDGMPNAETAKYSKLDNNTAYGYIREIENRCGGKLNLETLEIEKQTEFKDGDIVHDVHGYNTYIIKEFSNKHIKIYAGLTKQYGALLHKIGISEIFHLRLATEEEKQQLFSALAKEGKAWDAEKKQIVDLKPKYEFKPMDLCLMKYIGKYNNRGWELCQYAYTEHRVSSIGEQRDFYHAVGGEIYAECIPYKGNEHLLGTKKSK